MGEKEVLLQPRSEPRAFAMNVALSSVLRETREPSLGSQPRVTPLNPAMSSSLGPSPTTWLQPGMAVALTGAPTAVTLRTRMGTIVRRDEYDDYVVVRLAIPAIYHHANDETEELSEIVVMADNLRVVGI